MYWSIEIIFFGYNPRRTLDALWQIYGDFQRKYVSQIEGITSGLFIATRK